MKSKLLMTVATATLLSACSSQLTDVNHKWCPPEQKVVVNEKIALSADALFYFDKSSSSELLPAGRKTLDELIGKITSDYAKVESITLVGHTDRLGSEHYNYKLGLRRAETVKAYLENAGIDAQISTASAGKNQPMTTDCVGEKATKSLIACL